MKITRQDPGSAETATDPIFIGEVRSQVLVGDDDAPSQRVTVVTFVDGARNRWHTHTTEQVLVVTSGEGIVADDTGEYPISEGDVVLVDPGERHWHGARSGRDMTHLSILLPGRMEITD